MSRDRVRSIVARRRWGNAADRGVSALYFRRVIHVRRGPGAVPLLLRVAGARSRPRHIGLVRAGLRGMLPALARTRDLERRRRAARGSGTDLAQGPLPRA